MRQALALVNKIQNNIGFIARICRADVGVDVKIKAALQLVIGPLLAVVGMPIFLWGVVLVLPAGFGIIPEERVISLMVIGVVVETVGLLFVFGIKP